MPRSNTLIVTAPGDVGGSNLPIPGSKGIARGLSLTSTTALNGSVLHAASGGLTLPGANDLVLNYGPVVSYDGGTVGDFFVATDGSDANAGTTVGAPFATFQAAINAANTAGGSQTILVRGGTYRQSATLAGTTADITFKRYGTELPVMTAQEPLTGWTQCSAGDSVEVGGNFAAIYKTTITLADLDHDGRHLLNLYQDGVRCNIAQDRAIDTNPHATLDDKTWHTGTFNTNGSDEILSITDAVVMAAYTEAQALDLIVALYYGDNRAGETTFSAFDTGTDTGTLTLQTLLEHQSGAAGHRYALINSPQAISEGRWACRSDGNGTTATVYFQPFTVGTLETGVEYTERAFVMDTGDAQGDIASYGIDYVGSAKDTNSGGGLCFGNETSLTNAKAGSVTIEHATIGKSAGFGYGPMYFNNFAGGIRLKNVRFTETSSHAGQITNCPDSRCDQMDFQTIGGSILRVFQTIRFSLTHSNALNVARNTHANLITMYLQSDYLLVWGLKVRENFGYFTWQESSNVTLGFLDIPATGVDDDDRAIGDQNIGTGEPSGAGTITYVTNIITHPSRDGGDRKSYATGSIRGTAWPYNFKNSILNGISDETPHIHDAGSTTGTLIHTILEPNSQQPVNVNYGTEHYQNEREFYEDAYNNEYVYRAGALIRTLPGDDISGDLAFLEARHPHFDHFDKDIEGRQYNMASPPMGPNLILPTPPTDPVFAKAPIVLGHDTWLELDEQIGWQQADGFTAAMRWTWDGVSSPYFLADAYDTYIRILATSTPIMRLTAEGSNGLDIAFEEVVLSGWAAGQESSFVWSVTRTSFQLWLDGTLVIDLSGLTDQGPIQVPLRINATNSSGLDAGDFEFEALWMSIDGAIDASTAAAALFDDSVVSGVYEPTDAMLDGDTISGLRPHFFESRADYFKTLAGYVTDSVGPVLTLPTGTEDGPLGVASIGVTSDEGAGILYWGVYTAASTPTIAAIKAGTGADLNGSQAVSATGVQTIADQTGLTPDTDYKIWFVQDDDATVINTSNVVETATFTTDPADVTAPVLTLPTADENAATGATNISVTTDETDGILDWGIYPAASTPTGAEVIAGTGGAVVNGFTTVTASGVQLVADQVGLTELTDYKVHFVHTDASSNSSAVASTATFTTLAAVAYVQNLYNTNGTFFTQKLARDTPNAATFEFSAWINPQVATTKMEFWNNQYSEIGLSASGELVVIIKDSAAANSYVDTGIAADMPVGTLSHVYVGADFSNASAGIVEVRINGAIPTGFADASTITSTGLIRLDEFFGMWADVNGNAKADVIFGDPYINFGQARVGHAALYNGGTPPDLAGIVSSPFVRQGEDQTAAEISNAENFGSAVLTVPGTSTGLTDV